MEAIRSYLPHAGPDEKLACRLPHPMTASHPQDRSLFAAVFKRKRAESHDPAPLPEDAAKRQRLDVPLPAALPTVVPAPVSAPAAAPMSAPAPVATPVTTTPAQSADAPAIATAPSASFAPEPVVQCQSTAAPKLDMSKLDRARHKIESTINYEILLRHDELRLIEQEIAKCLVSIEQIRRCKQIPYPGQPGATATSYQAATGEVGALEPAPGFTRPLQPAGFGVTDGPYSRHYAHWLIPDPRFDSVSAESLQTMAATRSFERSSFASSRSGRHSLSLHQSLPSNYPVPKAQPGPLVIKRLSDGKMVKLVCVWCQKENVSSVQGFLNHCRIAHGEGFASHEQAAQRCGQPVDEAQLPVVAPAAGPAPSAVQTPVTPIVQTLIAQTPTAMTPAAATCSTLVHPLNATKEKGPDHPATKLVETARSTSTDTSRKSRPLALNIPKTDQSKFVASGAAPRLSAIFEKAGVQVDLGKLVANAQVKCNMDDITPLDEDDSEESPLQKPTQAPVARTVVSQPSKTVSIPGSNKFRLPEPHASMDSASSSVVSTPTTSFMARPLGLSADSRRTPGSPTDVSMTNSPEFGLSPHADHNPGLVSDNEEDDLETPSEVSDSEDHHHDQAQRAVQVQVRSHNDLLHDHVVAANEDTETGALSCAFQPSAQSAADRAPEAPKRKRGRPSKASQSKVKGG